MGPPKQAPMGGDLREERMAPLRIVLDDATMADARARLATGRTVGGGFGSRAYAYCLGGATACSV
jgi:hypothetical protein